MIRIEKLSKNFFLVCVLCVSSSHAQGTCREVLTLTESDLTITEEVSRDREFDVDVETSFVDEGKNAVLVRTNLLGDDQEEETTPLHFSVVQAGIMTGWQISAGSPSAERILAPPAGVKKLRIFISTESDNLRKFNLTVSVFDFLLVPDQAKDGVVVAKNKPKVFRFRFPKNVKQDIFMVKITNSSLAACTIVAIQRADKVQQAFFDDESNIRYGSSYQTMLQKSAMIVTRKNYPDGFNLVLLVKSDSSDCYRKEEPSNEERNLKSMTVRVVVESLRNGIMTEDIVNDSIIIVIGFYVALAIIFFGITFVLDRCFGFELEGMYGTVEAVLKHRERLTRKEAATTALMNTVNLAMISHDQVDGPALEEQASIEEEKVPSFRFPWQREWHPQTEDTNTVEDGTENTTCIDSVDGVEENGGIVETEGNARAWTQLAKPHSSTSKPAKTIPNFRTLDQTSKTVKECHRQRLRSQLFSWLIVLSGIFYALPAFQMVFNHQNPFIKGGDQDICYYNFFCLFPYGKLADFGHVFSNIGYCIAGLYFILKVYIRRLKFEKSKEKIESTGIPEQVGIFYALGGALTLEGVLSGIYHICPTSANFQFDTTFMFFIAVLIFLKLYQFRHADTTLTAQLVFLLIGVILTLEVIGYFTSHIVFWAVFIFIYMIFMLIFILKLYLDEKNFKTVFRFIYNKLTNCCSLEKGSIGVLDILPCMFVILINILMATFFAISQRPGVSRYLLAILMINMMCYEVYYVSRKVHLRLRVHNWRENEGIRPITLVYLVMSMVFMAGACYFFIKELKTSAGTPAESRNKNDECALLIFDNHDMWHFLSAAGLYQHFMFLLTLEDYNISYMKQRKLITVF